jgi:hypothetical protein
VVGDLFLYVCSSSDCLILNCFYLYLDDEDFTACSSVVIENLSGSARTDYMSNHTLIERLRIKNKVSGSDEIASYSKRLKGRHPPHRILLTDGSFFFLSFLFPIQVMDTDGHEFNSTTSPMSVLSTSSTSSMSLSMSSSTCLSPPCLLLQKSAGKRTPKKRKQPSDEVAVAEVDLSLPSMISQVDSYLNCDFQFNEFFFN